MGYQEKSHFLAFQRFGYSNVALTESGNSALKHRTQLSLLEAI